MRFYLDFLHFKVSILIVYCVTVFVESLNFFRDSAKFPINVSVKFYELFAQSKHNFVKFYITNVYRYNGHPNFQS